MFKSRVFVFILLALATLTIQLVLSLGKTGEQQCCPRVPDILMGYPGKTSPDSNR
jgi:hypothetical protein